MKRLRLAVAALVLIALAGIGVYAMRPAPVPATDFADALRGPASPSLSIPFGAYALTPEGLLRTTSTSGRESGIDRPMVKTLSGSYLSRDFAFEVDVMIPAEIQDLAFVGFGQGDPNPGLSNEPGAAFIFRIHRLSNTDAVHAAAARPPGGRLNTTVSPAEVLLRLEAIGKYVPGTKTTFRIERAGHVVALSMPGVPEARSAFDLRDYPKLFDEEAGFLFFGNSAEGTVFSNVRVRPRG
ncbi:MAG: hypothetical protein H0X44_06930 [Acidobacteria bacterium]|nr:hypothetical protein [Acidobacteriota bacterium]